MARDLINYGLKLASWQPLLERVMQCIMARTHYDMLQATNIAYSMVRDGATYQDLETLPLVMTNDTHLRKIISMLVEGRHFAFHPCGQLYVVSAYGGSITFECLRESGPDILCPKCNLPFGEGQEQHLERYFVFEVKHPCGQEYLFYEKEQEFFVINPRSGYKVTGCENCGLPLYPMKEHSVDRNVPIHWTEYLTHKEVYDWKLREAIEEGRKNGHYSSETLRRGPLEIEPIELDGELVWCT